MEPSHTPMGTDMTRPPATLIYVLIEIGAEAIFTRRWTPWIRYVLLIVLVFILITGWRLVAVNMPSPLPR